MWIDRIFSNELYSTFGVSISAVVYDSEKGDIGAVLRRLGIPGSRLGLAVHIATENGCYAFEPPVDKVSSAPPPERPRQLCFNLNLPYDEIAHLRPDGTRKRKR